MKKLPEGPSRMLDLLVHEKIFGRKHMRVKVLDGWKHSPGVPKLTKNVGVGLLDTTHMPSGINVGYEMHLGHPVLKADEVMHFSSSWTDALFIVRELRRHGLSQFMSWHEEKGARCNVVVGKGQAINGEIGSATADDFPEALCRAALMAFKTLKRKPKKQDW